MSRVLGARSTRCCARCLITKALRDVRAALGLKGIVLAAQEESRKVSVDGVWLVQM